jgi:hypothetical protein
LAEEMKPLTTDQEAMLANWEECFRLPCAGCRELCPCGKEYYNPGGGWDWEDGELEKLEADPNAFVVDYSIGRIEFNGQQYADACDCWKAVALRVIGFLDWHMDGIREFIEKERLRRLSEFKSDSFVVGLDTPPKPQGKRKILLED